MNGFDEALQLSQMVYASYPTGSPLHIVLDDGNMEDEYILWCMQNSIAECNDGRSALLLYRCAVALLDLDLEDRYTISRWI